MLEMVATGMKTGAFLLIALTLVPPSLSCDRFLHGPDLADFAKGKILILLFCSGHWGCPRKVYVPTLQKYQASNWASYERPARSLLTMLVTDFVTMPHELSNEHREQITNRSFVTGQLLARVAKSLIRKFCH